MSKCMKLSIVFKRMIAASDCTYIIRELENAVKLYVSFITWAILQFMRAINLVDA